MDGAVSRPPGWPLSLVLAAYAIAGPFPLSLFELNLDMYCCVKDESPDRCQFGGDLEKLLGVPVYHFHLLSMSLLYLILD